MYDLQIPYSSFTIHNSPSLLPRFHGCNLTDGDLDGLTNFIELANFDEGSQEPGTPRIDNGDVMLTPLLEIKIAAPESNSANPSGSLPVADSFSGSITNQTDLANWLDQARLDDFGISVHQDEETGDLYSYLPLGMVEDEVGDTPVAWSAQMLYEPENGSWGAEHEIRLVWMVTTLVNNCVTSDMPATFSYTDSQG